jgi:uncharacterized repeat protein (TIGR03847 family)
VISVALEKVQVAALAERLEELLDEARRRGGEVPTVAPQELEDVAPLDQPIVEEFRVGTLALAWDGEEDRVVIEAMAVTEAVTGEDEEADQAVLGDDDNGPDVLRVRLNPAAAKAFAKRAARVVAAGRPPCPFCGQPLDPEGHICPRQNGHRH